MNRIVMTIAGAAGFVAAAGACSFASLADLSSGNADGGVGVDDGDAGAHSDGEPVQEGGADGDAAATPFCETVTPKPLFCDDFERTDPQGSWTGTSASNGGAVSVTSSTRGAGRELLVTIPLSGAGDSPDARLGLKLPEARELSLSYALRVDGPPAQGSQQLMNLVVQLGNADTFGIYVFVKQERIAVVEQTFPADPGIDGVFVQHTLEEPLVFGRWQRVDMVVTYAAPPRLRFVVDGKSAYDGPLDAFFRPGAPTLSAGIHYVETPTSALSVHVDDLYVGVQ